jgi:hypothetical protein
MFLAILIGILFAIPYGEEGVVVVVWWCSGWRDVLTRNGSQGPLSTIKAGDGEGEETKRAKSMEMKEFPNTGGGVGSLCYIFPA